MKIWGCLLILFSMTFIQITVADEGAQMAPVVSGFRGDSLMLQSEVEKKIEDLAAAMPAEKYSWRPGEGVRSVGEVYMHIAGANYFVLKMAGVETPAGMGASENMDKDANDKAKVADALKQSSEFLRQTIVKTADSDLDKKVKLFGQEMTMRGVFMLLVGHMQEHLGQSIAYARMNGVVPPWTAAQQKQSPK